MKTSSFPWAAEQLLLEEEVSGERSLRRKNSLVLGPLADTSRRAKKQLTPEEIEERNKKVGGLMGDPQNDVLNLYLFNVLEIKFK